MEKINNKEAISLIVSSSLGITVLVASQIIASTCLSSSLINTGIISIIALALTVIICALYKKFIGISFLDITEYFGGRFLKFIVGLIFLLYFLFTAAIVLCKAVNTLQIVYYPMTNISYIVLFFLFTTAFACNLKNNGFLRATFMIVPIVIIAIFFIFAGNLKNFNYENIFPILGNGWNATFGIGLTNLYTFGGIAYLFFVPQNLKRPDKFMSISVISTITSSILLTLTVAPIILMFNRNVTSGQLFPLYIAVRYIEFGTFFQRMDAAFIFLCVLGLISALNINLYFILEIFKNIMNLSDSKPLIFPCLLLSFSIALGIKQDSTLNLLENQVSKLLFIIFGIGIPLIILILAVIKKKKYKKSK
jgi:spore germination protein (amino acid permease)